MVVVLMGCGFSNVSSATVDSKDSDFQTSADSFAGIRAKVSKDASEIMQNYAKGPILIFKPQKRQKIICMLHDIRIFNGCEKQNDNYFPFKKKSFCSCFCQLIQIFFLICMHACTNEKVH